MPVEIDSKLRASIEAIKVELGHGEVAIRERQTGKTTAILEFIHEYCSGFCYLIVPNENMANLTRAMYRHRYPDDEQPVVLSFASLMPVQVQGLTRVWMTDEVWPGAVEKKAWPCELLTYLGGVGSWPSMDAHSNRV